MNSEKGPKQKATTEYVVLVIIIIVAIIIILLIFLVLKPKLDNKSTTTATPLPGTNGSGCATSLAPTGLVSNQVVTTSPTMDVSWNAVLTTTTPGESILGYNIYVSRFPNVKSTLAPQFTVIPMKRLLSDSASKLVAATQYYWRVATVDSCGVGILSDEQTFTTV